MVKQHMKNWRRSLERCEKKRCCLCEAQKEMLRMEILEHEEILENQEPKPEPCLCNGES